MWGRSFSGAWQGKPSPWKTGGFLGETGHNPGMAKSRKIFRTDHAACPLNAVKKSAVDDFLHDWKRGVAVEARAAWREWAERGAFRSTVVTAGDPLPACHEILGVSFGQMCMAQTRDALRGWVAGLEDRVRAVISESSLDPALRHPLHSLNLQHAWGGGRDRALVCGGHENPRPIAPETRALFKSIVRHVLRHTRRPDLRRLWPKIDQRMVQLAPAANAKAFGAWLRLSTLAPGRRLDLPVVLNARVRNRLALAATAPEPAPEPKRAGESATTSIGKPRKAKSPKPSSLPIPPGWCHLAKTVQLLPQADGTLKIGLFTDLKPVFAQTAGAYVPRTAELALDIGLTNLFATDQGDLLGRYWGAQIARIDRTLTAIASARQAAGLKVRGPRYDRHVQRLRGLVKTEVNRILNRRVATHRPGKLIFEHVDFRGGGLSRRLNRLLSLVGMRTLKTKLTDLEQRYGIVAEFRASAYTSQECSSCGYVDAKNRSTQANFRCLFCNLQLHADVNASRVIRFGRSETPGSSAASRKRVLHERVRRFVARYPNPRSRPPTGRELRPSGRPGDPRWRNPYFTQWAKASMGGVSIGSSAGAEAATRQTEPTLKSE